MAQVDELTTDGRQDETLEIIKKQKRIFTHSMRKACWKKQAQTVMGRDPQRWRYDAAGNLVCRALTNCPGVLCHEYDHIVPYSKGGETSVENCQILQTRVNRRKRDYVDQDRDLLTQHIIKHSFSNYDMDIIEIALWGDVKRQFQGFPDVMLMCAVKSEDVNTVKCEDYVKQQKQL
ncbi:hypothetical protein MP228_011274 [Amoeboaphelidium protococcarum]|nr:hypothetical protein MP228_011274 [Amoeboaphelidium protococcarum]